MCFRFTLLSMLLFCASLIYAQPAAPDNFLILKLNQDQALSEVHSIPLAAEPFLSFSIKWTANDWEIDLYQFEVRFSSDAGQWDDWQALKADAHTAFEHPSYLSSLVFANPTAQYFQLRIAATGAIPNIEALEVHFYNPGKTQVGAPATPTLTERNFCPCPEPDFEGRLDWCPTGDCPVDATPAFTTVTHLIVHHSAGSNTSSDWAARVRAIWNSHVNGNGWDDIGYNWLIDPDGVLYQGRGESVRGAHFCGTNGGTMGVCMIGTYTDVLPTEAALNTLRNLLAWKSCFDNIDPLDFSFHSSSGLNLFHISGHRDGCATECPGELFYPTLEDMRDSVANIIENCSAIPGPNNLTATLTDDTTVDLEWQDYTDNETAFELFRSMGGADDFQLLATLPENTTSYTDEGVIPMEGYDYQVRAVVDIVPSEFSNVASIVPVISGLSAAPDQQLFQCFPNPTTGIINLNFTQQLEGQVQIRIIAANSGILFKTFEVAQGITQLSIDLIGLPKGMFLIEVRDQDSIAIEKVIKL